MTYKVFLKESEEGFAVWCPGLPGCASQGQTEQEALESITDAIREYLIVASELGAQEGAKAATVEVQDVA